MVAGANSFLKRYLRKKSNKPKPKEECMTKDKNLSYQEAREFLGMKHGTLYSLVSRRQIPHIRLSPRLVRFSLRELEFWLESNAVPAKSTTDGKRK